MTSNVALAGLLLLSLLSCHSQPKADPAPAASAHSSEASEVSITTPTADKLTILALGDSYTIGQGLPAASRWPVLLAAQLGSQQTPQIIAQTGWTTQDLIQALLGNQLQAHSDLVTLMIGVNNQYQGRPLSEYRKQFENLLKQALAAAPSPACVLVVSIPDWGATPFAQGQDTRQIGSQIAAFNAINLELSQNYQTSYLDITPLSREQAPERFASDGLHYSQQMHQIWAERAAKVLKMDCLRARDLASE